MTGRNKRVTICCLFLTGLLGLCSCGSPSSDSMGSVVTVDLVEQAEDAAKELVYVSSMELQYAENFSIDYYEGGYTMLTVKDGTKLLVVPEGEEVPEGVDED
ncbi:MAG: hypothetical protein E7292_02425 [Lachnospiraceae bacterium]|nr:hypothetical protein [Lachnospiraceae bacterium]